MQILAVDLDVGAVRAAIVEVETGKLLSSIARAGYLVDHPVAEAAEVALDHVWSAVGAAARSVAQPIDGIEGVGLCAVTPAPVLLDEKDRPAARVCYPEDRRARAAARQVQSDVGAELLRETGNGPLPGFVSALSFRRMLEDDPYLIREVRRYLHLNGWLALHVTGNAAFDPANASLTGVYGTTGNCNWSPRWCEYFEIDPAWLPPVVDGAATVGTIRSAVADELGVPAGVPLKLGTDATSLMIHAAELTEGDVFHDVADPQKLSIRVDRPRADGLRLVHRIGVGDGFVETVFNPIGPDALRWIHQLCFREQSEEEFRQHTIPQAMERKARAVFDPPFLTGDTTGIVACRAAFRELTKATDRMDLLAALFSEMRRRHETAMELLGRNRAAHGVFVGGSNAHFTTGLLPYGKSVPSRFIQTEPLEAIAGLFRV